MERPRAGFFAIRIHCTERTNIGPGRCRNSCRPNCGCRCADRSALRAATAPSPHNPCSCATRPRLAPIHLPAPKPSPRASAGASARNDKSPSRTARRRPKSNRHRCRPSGLRCRAANRATLPLRAVARRNHKQRFRAIRRMDRASDKTFRRRPWIVFPSGFQFSR
jgi:hypothetical protein